LRADFEAAGQGALFQAIKGCLSSAADHAAYGGIGERLGLSADAVAMAVMRLRREYRALVRAEVARTVATPAEIDDEMRYLVELLVR
jgi:RNA polymerase sigma-70 factor (ECF subfamily)